jgi:hypothetical protein
LPFLNDTQEYRHGIAVALDALRKLLTKSPHTQEVMKFLKSFLLDSYRPNDIFSSSFSTKGDDLSQWRGYGGSGPSFAVGFDAKKLEAHALGYRFALHEVKYRKKLIESDVRIQLRQTIVDIRNKMRSGASMSPLEFAKEEGPFLASSLLMMAPSYKHPKFAAEKEWRLIRHLPVVSGRPRLPLKFRSSGSLVVPYISLPLHTPTEQFGEEGNATSVDTPIRSITIGPSPHPEELIYAIGEMAAKRGLQLNVRSSAIPFRNW